MAKNEDKSFSACKMGCRVFDRHDQDVDSHCLLKSKMKIPCQVYFYRSNNFFQTTCQIFCLLQSAKSDFNQECPKSTRRNMTPINFLKEQFMISLFLKVSFFPSAKSNKEGGKAFLRKFWVSQGKTLRLLF